MRPAILSKKQIQSGDAGREKKVIVLSIQNSSQYSMATCRRRLKLVFRSFRTDTRNTNFAEDISALQMYSSSFNK